MDVNGTKRSGCMRDTVQYSVAGVSVGAFVSRIQLAISAGGESKPVTTNKLGGVPTVSEKTPQKDILGTEKGTGHKRGPQKRFINSGTCENSQGRGHERENCKDL